MGYVLNVELIYMEIFVIADHRAKLSSAFHNDMLQVGGVWEVGGRHSQDR